MISMAIAMAHAQMISHLDGRLASTKIRRMGQVQCDCLKLILAHPFHGALVPLRVVPTKEPKTQRKQRKDKPRQGRRRPHGSRLHGSRRCGRRRHRQRLILTLVPPGLTPSSSRNYSLSIHRRLRQTIHHPQFIIVPIPILTLLSILTCTHLSPHQLIMTLPTATLVAQVVREVILIQKMLL